MPSYLDQLGARWQKELRIRYLGDPRLGQLHIGRARALVGIMERLRSLSAPGHVAKQERYADGTRIRVFYTGREWIAEIDTRNLTSETVSEDQLWVPTGIVCTPANNSSLTGWGIPASTFAVNKLDPGLEALSWTSAGALPQVLVTDQPNAGYPRTRATLPVYFDEYERPTQRHRVRHGLDFAAFKPRFRNLGTRFAAILAEINDRRDPDEPLTPSLFGYADIAAEYSRLVRRFGFDTTRYPIGAATTERIVEKEGTVNVIAATGAVRGAIGTGTITGTPTVDQVVDSLETAEPSLTNTDLKKGSSFSLVGSGNIFFALLDHNDQWIKCGNIDWVSIHAELPRLSWFGSRGRSIPSWELGAGLQTTTTYNGTPVPSVTYTSYMLDTAIADFDGMKLPQFTPFVFSQGRLLAVAPEHGFVLGAGIQRLEADDDHPTIRYMLFAITWHRADQQYQSGSIDTSNPEAIFWDTTSDFRVYKAEVELRNGVLSPDYYIYDLKDDANPNGWELIDRFRFSTAVPPAQIHWLGEFPEHGGYSDDEFNASKAYWQTWLFNGSGTEAMCIRSTVYVQRSPIGVHALVQTGCAFPSHAIRCTVEEESAHVSSFMEFPTFIDVGNRLPIAIDYVGDDMRIGIFGTESGAPAGTLRIEDTAGHAFVEWAPFGAGPACMAYAYDARNDSAIINTTEVVGGLVDSNTVRCFVNGALVGVSTFAAGGVAVGYLGWGVNFNIAYGPEWMVHGHPLVIPALAVVDGAFVVGSWHGSVPGSASGVSPYIPATVFHTLAREFRTSIEDFAEALQCPNGWFDFAGAV